MDLFTNLAHGFGVAATGADVVQDPQLVPLFLFDVFVQWGVQPGVAGRQGLLAGLQQRHGVAHMVEGLAQEGLVAG